MDSLFLGKGGFFWWVGRVVSNADPLGLGRCRVRIVGYHTDNENELPDIALPWAYPVTPITNAGIGGIGVSPVGPQPGSKVVGWFADGEMAQQPIMFGTLPGESVFETKKGLENGSTPSQPLIDKIIGNAPFKREGDCPDGYDINSTRTNLIIPDDKDIQADPGEWTLPFTGFVSSAYAERSGKHHGVDICPAGFYKQTNAGASHLHGALKGPTGLPVYAAADGVVVHIWTADKGQGGRPTTYDKNRLGSRSFGNAIAIKHVLSTGTYTTIYAHLGVSQDAALDAPGTGILVSVGQSVKKGQKIGTCGRSHCYDSPTHLHFEIRIGDALPKASNHRNPGIFFPQLRHRHHSHLAWVKAQTSYNVEPFYKISDAPVKAKQRPMEV
jgi:murein DD-endopeptidase MepM/ murein hydrolase activator NlpD